VLVPAERILIVLLGAIGDVTRALPLLARLRAGYPRAHIAWAVEPAAAPILELHPALDERILFERRRGLFGFAEFLRRVRKGHFDLALDLQRHAKSGVTSFASRAPVRIGFHRRNAKELNWVWNTRTIDPVDERGWKLEQYLRFGDVLQLDPVPVRFDITLSSAEVSRVERLLADVARPFGVLFLGSTWESRLWFPERFAAVADALDDRGLATVLVGGDDVVDLGREIVARARRAPLDLCGRSSLRESYGVLARGRVAVGPDSGPMHLAAAAGTPVVSLWGATTPARSAPWGSEDLVVVGRVACAPCYRRRCPVDHACMDDISVPRVVAQVDRVLEERR